MLEGEAAALAADRRSDADLAAMALRSSEMAEGLDDRDAYAPADVRFHVAVAAATGNRVALHAMHAIRELLERALEQVYGIPGSAARSLEQHRQILAAIEAGRRRGGARMRMRTHLTRVEREIHDAVTSSRLADFSDAASTARREGVAAMAQDRLSSGWASWVAASPAACSMPATTSPATTARAARRMRWSRRACALAATPARGRRAQRRHVLDGHQHRRRSRPSPRAPTASSPGSAPGKVYVDMSTVSPAASRALAEQVPSAGADMLDAPVSGSVITLEQGKLSVIVGGDAATFERVEPILRDIGPTVTHVGGNGQAVLMKIATNLSLAVQMLAFSEGVLLAEKGGISREDAVRRADQQRDRVADGAVPRAVRARDAGRGLVRLQHDAEGHGARARSGRELDVPLPTTAATNEILTAARGMGLDKHDFAVMFDVLAQLAGLRGAGALMARRPRIAAVACARPLRADADDPRLRGARQRALHARQDAGARPPLHRRGGHRRRRLRGAARDDYITSTHRGHGHCLAKGAVDRPDVRRAARARRPATAGARAARCTSPTSSTGNLGANAIVGGSAGIATGAALSAQMRESGQVAVCFFGEGALGQGLLYEVMNMARSGSCR